MSWCNYSTSTSIVRSFCQRGESDKRGIYGETSPEQAEALQEEGIEFSRIPWVPRADG